MSEEKEVDEQAATPEPRQYPPFGEKKFWDWHFECERKNARKREIGETVRGFVRHVVEMYSEDGYDPRRDVAWFMEHAGTSLRSEVEKELAKAREEARKAATD
jgi:hypothetical protein